MTVNDENVKFRNELTIVAPYVEDAKLLELKSRWARMTNEFEYETIKAEVQGIIKELELRNWKK